MAKPSPEQIKRRALASERHKARHFAMQGLYQWQLNATQANEISAPVSYTHLTLPTKA